MTSVDSNTFLSDGGCLQKGVDKNIKPGDLGNKAHFLAPSRWYRDEKIFQLEKRALFSTVSGACLLSNFRILVSAQMEWVHLDACGTEDEALTYMHWR